MAVLSKHPISFFLINLLCLCRILSRFILRKKSHLLIAIMLLFASEEEEEICVVVEEILADVTCNIP